LQLLAVKLPTQRAVLILGQATMKIVKTYSTGLDANLAKIALAAQGVSSVVVGVGSELEGGASGVQLMVADESVDTALKVLQRL
jgi:hypothetical protein